MTTQWTEADSWKRFQKLAMRLECVNPSEADIADIAWAVAEITRLRGLVAGEGDEERRRIRHYQDIVQAGKWADELRQRDAKPEQSKPPEPAKEGTPLTLEGLRKLIEVAIDHMNEPGNSHVTTLRAMQHAIRERLKGRGS